MADILRVATHAPDFFRAASIHLVETSPTLRQRQAETLRACGIEPSWHASFSDAPAGPLLLVANEFFDALPIRQFVRLDVWRERAIGLDARGRLGFGIGPGVLDRGGPDARHGSILEIRPAAEALVAEISKRIVAHGGAALIIDYGHAETAPGETLQAMQGHAFCDPLAEPGEADITAHVDFGALAAEALRAGAAAHGPMPQGRFLTALGLVERAGRLGANADESVSETLRAAVERLAGADEMGALFKVLALTRPGLVPPPFGG
jgi:SAM-dependent MidA family methyltransferase